MITEERFRAVLSNAHARKEVLVIDDIEETNNYVIMKISNGECWTIEKYGENYSDYKKGMEIGIRSHPAQVVRITPNEWKITPWKEKFFIHKDDKIIFEEEK